MRRSTIAAAALASLTLGCSPTVFQQTDRGGLNAQNGDRVTVTGEVVSRADDRFVLATGGKRILVELDGYGVRDDRGSFDADAATWLAPGDRVKVTGMMDKDRYEVDSIEAETVRVAESSTVYKGLPVDDEGGGYGLEPLEWARDGDPVIFSGSVMLQRGDTMVVDSGLQRLNVDVGGVRSGSPIQRHDWVTVRGVMDEPFFGPRQLLARSVERTAAE